MMKKIQMTTPIVEMDGDEMTRVLWKMIKDELILPFVELKSEYYDLGLKHRDETNDEVTVQAALANKKYGVSVNPSFKVLDISSVRGLTYSFCFHWI